MARVKFLLFALPALVAGTWLLASSSPRLADAAVHQAERSASAAGPAFEVRIARERVWLEGLLARGAAAWASMPQAAGHAPLRGEALADTFTALRASMTAGLPDSKRAALVLAVASGPAALASRGEAAAAETLEGLVLKEAVQAGADGAVLGAFGTPHAFYALQISPPERGSLVLVVGAPLVSWEITNEVARETQLAAVGVVHGGKLVADAGVAKAALKGFAAIREKGIQGTHGAAIKLGPLALPWTGGGAPFETVLSRYTIPGTTLDVLGLASVEPAMRALADSQRDALFAFAGLTALAALMLVLLRSPPAPAMSITKSGARRVTGEITTPPRSPPPDRLPVMDSAPPAETHPDEFQFPASLSTSAPSEPRFGDAETSPTAEMPAQDGDYSFEGRDRVPPSEPGLTRAERPPLPEELPPASPDDFAQAPEGFAEPDGYAPPEGGGSLPPPVPENPFEESEQPTTIAYPAGVYPTESPPDGEFNPDATRVAIVPAELLEQSARQEALGHEGPTRPLSEAQHPPPVPHSETSPEEAHFQTVFRDFVATRERCGESADGLTYDRFAAKLRKNRDQLVQKYSCRTVRFQVYVKDGKAALKATPVRD